MDRVESWGTDLELLSAAKVLRTDIFVYNHFGTDFQLMVSTTNVQDLTQKRVYLRLYFNHFQPVLKVLNDGYVEDIGSV